MPVLIFSYPDVGDVRDLRFLISDFRLNSREQAGVFQSEIKNQKS
jgi:hypothetical protein